MEALNGKIIWTLWWQGIDNAPPLVQKCIKSMKNNWKDGTVIVLDQNNYKNYVQLPDYIMEKVNSGVITITHLSDILRFRLLYQYGGFWVDSTVYVSKPIPAELFETEFYSIHQDCKEDKKNISQFKWTAFFLGGKKGNIIFEKMCALFDAYWKENEALLCYFLVDFFLYLIYENCCDAHELIDKIKIYDGNIFYLNKLLYTDFVKVLDNLPLFNKLSWKENYPQQTPEGKDTLYQVIIGEKGSAPKRSKMKALSGRLKIEFSKEKRNNFGLGFCCKSFLYTCLQSDVFHCEEIYASKYNQLILSYLKKYKAIL